MEKIVGVAKLISGATSGIRFLKVRVKINYYCLA